MEKVRVLGSRIPNKFSPLQVTVLSSLGTVSTSLPAINWDHRLGVLEILLDWYFLHTFREGVKKKPLNL